MSAAAKSPRDKPNLAPRLTPRPTAASTARAAKNASSLKGQTPPPRTQKNSPSRISVRKLGVVSESKFDAAQKENDLPSANTKMIENEDTVTITTSNTLQSFDGSETVSMVSDESKRASIPPENKSRSQTPVRSRPHTPVKSRPQTPSRSDNPKMTSQSSRPHTPHSRPVTPAVQTRQNPSNRSPTPQIPRRQLALKHPTPINRNVPTNIESDVSSSSGQIEEDLKSTYILKQNEFQEMKKELDFKQQAVLRMFDYLRNLSERLAQEGKLGNGEGFQAQDLVVFNVGDWTTEEVAQLCRDASESGSMDMNLEVINSVKQDDENILDDLDSKVTKLPTCFAELCLQAFTARQELIDWVKQLLGNVDDGNNEGIDRIAQYNQQGLELCEALRDLKMRADDAVEGVLQFSRRAYRERSKLISVGETLVREISRLRRDIDKITQNKPICSESEAMQAVEEARKELQEEKVNRIALSKKLNITESQLRQSQIRVSKMDRQLREAEASIANLTGTVKSLEDQSRQRETQLEVRARKLKENLKTSELSTNQLIQQRDFLQKEIQSLKEHTENMQNQNKSTIEQLSNEVEELRNALEEQRKETEKELIARNTLEEKLIHDEQIMAELKQRNRELELSKNTPELPTEREMDLWAELQATKDALRMTEDEVSQYKQEKVRFLESITKIAESDNKIEMQQKLAAELLSKEEILSKMQAQMREVAKQLKLNEQKVLHYEQYIRDLQAHNKSLISQGVENTHGTSLQELQKDILTLRMGLLDSTHRNEELAEILAQKEQQLEQQDKTSRTQARVIKVREELINMLKNKEAEQSQEMAALQQDLEQRMKIVEEVNKQIASKAEEIQELFTTLENKQQQIHRLEKIVLALEEQQRRTQAQRTRYEEKIAALEHELAACKGRERKFIFF